VGRADACAYVYGNGGIRRNSYIKPEIHQIKMFINCFSVNINYYTVFMLEFSVGIKSPCSSIFFCFCPFLCLHSKKKAPVLGKLSLLCV